MNQGCNVMQDSLRLLRAVTYNVHKCRGLDGRVRPERIAEVLREVDADVIALQEITCLGVKDLEEDHARYLANELGFHLAFGENRRLGNAAYGNALLTRVPIQASYNYDITSRGREPRGCLRADVMLDGGRMLHIFNVHLGTDYFERRKQARMLLGAGILNNIEEDSTRLVLGDFNEWTRGLASQLFARNFNTADPRVHLGRGHTYPGLLPFLHLDHVYFDSTLKLQKLTLHRSQRALIASDHLPFIADFSVSGSESIPTHSIDHRTSRAVSPRSSG